MNTSITIQKETLDEKNSNSNPRIDTLRNCFKYQDGKSSAPITHTTTVTITGWEEQYPSAGGYICDMSGNYTHSQVSDLLADLRTYNWIDGGTRVVLLELSMYSTNENIFAYGLLMVEFWPTGAILTYPTISTVIVDESDSPVLYVVRILLRVIIYLYVLGYIRGEYNEVKASGCRVYLCSCWNWIDLVNYFLFTIS
jgi:cystathionine beta-lyase/cystathionine gamma-synthase